MNDPRDGHSTPRDQHQTAAMARLLQAARTLAGQVVLENVLNVITTEASGAVDCERALLVRVDGEPDDGTQDGSVRCFAAPPAGSPPGVAEEVVRTRRPCIVVRSANGGGRRISDGTQPDNVLAVPILATTGERVLGAIELVNKREGEFDAADVQVAAAFAEHAAMALERVRLVDEIKENEALRASLQMARDIQRSFMPVRAPEVPGYELAVWYMPTEAVGGDYCDCFPLKDGRTALVIADVSGHGLGPALLMASVRAALRALALEHIEPHRLLTLLARALHGDFRDGKFITMAVAALDSNHHSIHFANAGHGPILHFSKAKAKFHLVPTTGLPLGVDEGCDYHPSPPFELLPGDLLVFCTDGIVEVLDSAGRSFGVERLVRLLKREQDRPVQEIVEAVGRRVSEHVGNRTPSDDLTVLLIRRTEAAGPKAGGPVR
jgi:phosphoserine phosphatase